MKKPVAARAKVSTSVSSRAKTAPKKVVAKASLHKRVRIHGLIAVLIVALIAQVSYSFVTTGSVSVLGRVSNIQAAELLQDTNTERQEQGIGELKVNDKLSQAAFLKAQNMFSEQYWAHVSPSGIQPWKWLGDVGYN